MLVVDHTNGCCIDDPTAVYGNCHRGVFRAHKHKHLKHCHRHTRKLCLIVHLTDSLDLQIEIDRCSYYGGPFATTIPSSTEARERERERERGGKTYWYSKLRRTRHTTRSVNAPYELVWYIQIRGLLSNSIVARSFSGIYPKWPNPIAHAICVSCFYRQKNTPVSPPLNPPLAVERRLLTS